MPPVKRLYDALNAMMYGWEDDSVRLEGFAALKEAADWFAKDRRMTPTPDLMARACQAVLAVIGVDDRAGAQGSLGQAVVSPATQQLAADIARAVIDAIPDHAVDLIGGDVHGGKIARGSRG